MNVSRERCVPSLMVLYVACALATGCSEREGMQEPISPTPLVTAPERQTETPVAVRMQAGGVPTEYTAYDEGGELREIRERRDGADKAASYEFRGARLMRYRGTALETAGSIELEFDLKGSLTRAHGSEGPVTDEEVASIRSRAQLLRSHALAQQATRSHPMH